MSISFMEHKHHGLVNLIAPSNLGVQSYNSLGIVKSIPCVHQSNIPHNFEEIVKSVGFMCSSTPEFFFPQK